METNIVFIMGFKQRGQVVVNYLFQTSQSKRNPITFSQALFLQSQTCGLQKHMNAKVLNGNNFAFSQMSNIFNFLSQLKESFTTIGCQRFFRCPFYNSGLQGKRILSCSTTSGHWAKWETRLSRALYLNVGSQKVKMKK